MAITAGTRLGKTALSTGATLSPWLRLLWDLSPPLHFDSELPFIGGGAIHLPPHGDRTHRAAAAAHAAAHLVYSPARFDGAGLAPIARALVGLLEDARVEALAIRELPGLARLWRPLHAAAPTAGVGFEALMQRLARALADPGHDDPDPWVRKGRRLFYLDAGLGLLALRTPAEVRRAATLLGHDIGQMRLQFNGRSYRPAPAYRDDHRWMWEADAVAEAASPEPDPMSMSKPEPMPAPEPMQTLKPHRPEPRGAASGGHDPAEAVHAVIAHYPEWDHLISRLRPDWCRVVERFEDGAPVAPLVGDDPAGPRRLGGRLRNPLQRLLGPRGAWSRAEEGERFDPGALVALGTAWRMRQTPDVRVHRRLDPAVARGAVALLIDQSASTAAPHGSSAESGLRLAVRAAGAMAVALQALGVPCTIAGFASNSRHAVGLRTVKAFDALADGRLSERLAALRPGGSTRLGAVLRHASRALTRRGPGPLWLFVLSDAEPHDVDVHDPRYLPADARHAVREAGRQNVKIGCLVIGAAGCTGAAAIFGRRRIASLTDVARLPAALSRSFA